MHPCCRPSRPPLPRRPRGLLAGFLACWLLMQALGQAHALLHLRAAVGPPAVVMPASATASPASGLASVAPARQEPPVEPSPPATPRRPAAAAVAFSSGLAAALGRAFHPRSDAAGADDGVCCLCAQLAQGDLAPAGAPVAGIAGCALAPPALPAVVAAAAAPPRGAQARGPPAAG